jgi:hypothetical protein
LLMDSHQGLLLLHPAMQLPDGVLPRLLVLDPATRRRRATRCPTTAAGAAPGTTSAARFSRARTRAGSASRPSATPSTAGIRAPGSPP